MVCWVRDEAENFPDCSADLGGGGFLCFCFVLERQRVNWVSECAHHLLTPKSEANWPH